MSFTARKFLFSVLSAAYVCVVATGCSSMKIEQFEGTQPKFVLEEYFAGKTRAWGVVHDRFGKLRRQFTVDITGTWDGEKLVLVEDFLYSDGEKDQRIWTITKIDEHTYQGKAGDIIDVATGKLYGNALQWQYSMDLKMGEGDRTRVSFNDWMYLQPDNMLFNRAMISKLGIDVAEVSIFFRKL